MRFLAFVCGVCVAFLPVVAAASPNDADTRADAVGEVPSEMVSETQSENLRTVEVPVGAEKADATKQVNIGFIDSPTATCYQPDRRVDECFINWYYLSVSASPNYIIFMSATLNDIGGVALYQGFFQTSMYAPYNIHDRGFRVKCGPLVPSADPSVTPDHGNSYGYTIRARDTASLSSANYGIVYCPAFIP
jgi:hypothetical protein